MTAAWGAAILGLLGFFLGFGLSSSTPGLQEGADWALGALIGAVGVVVGGALGAVVGWLGRRAP